MIRERPNEGESSGQIVICHHERLPQPLVHVVFDLPQLLHDLLVCPALEWPTKIDADDLAQNTGVDTFEISLDLRKAFD